MISCTIILQKQRRNKEFLKQKPKECIARKSALQELLKEVFQYKRKLYRSEIWIYIFIGRVCHGKNKWRLIFFCVSLIDLKLTILKVITVTVYWIGEMDDSNIIRDDKEKTGILL